MTLNIISEQPVSSSEVREHLKKVKEELNFRAQKTLDHLDSLKPLSIKKATELLEALRKLEIPRLRDQQLVKIVDLLPVTDAEVKIVLQGYPLTVTTENMKKIAETVKTFVD